MSGMTLHEKVFNFLSDPIVLTFCKLTDKYGDTCTYMGVGDETWMRKDVAIRPFHTGPFFPQASRGNKTVFPIKKHSVALKTIFLKVIMKQDN